MKFHGKDAENASVAGRDCRLTASKAEQDRLNLQMAVGRPCGTW
jgi:hypothetical protein